MRKTNVTLHDIQIINLKKISNKNGDIMHFIKCSDQYYKKFGEVYFSWIKFGKIKAWKLHKEMALNLVVPYGNVKFVFHLPNEKMFREEKIGKNNYSRLYVPPGIWFGFKGLSKGNSLVSNFANIIHDPNESISVDQNYFLYNW